MSLATTCTDCGRLIPAGAQRCTTHQRQYHSRRNSEPDRAYHRSQDHRTRRGRIIQRDGWLCAHCQQRTHIPGKTPRPDDVTLDYVVPLAHGGAKDDSNARILCRSCNSAKGTR